MFNALNRFMSRLDGGDTPQRQQEQGSFGFQVLRNTNLELPIEPWFDFIVGINGRAIVCLRPIPTKELPSDSLDRTAPTLASSRKKCGTVLAAA
jgi:hypothetical protein